MGGKTQGAAGVMVVSSGVKAQIVLDSGAGRDVTSVTY